MRMTSTRPVYLWTTTRARSHGTTCGCRQWLTRTRRITTRLPAEDCLLPEPAGDAPDRRRQVQRASTAVGSSRNFATIRRLRPEDLCKLVMVKFEGDDALGWRRLPRVVLPLARDVRSELRPVRVLAPRQLHATYQPGLGRELGAL